VFVVWELTDAHPVVDLRLFKRRNFAAGSLALSIAYGLFFGNVVLLPLWLQQWMGYTARPAWRWRRWAFWPSCSPRWWARSGQLGSAQDGHGCLHGVCHGAVDALALHHRDRLLPILIPTLIQGVAMAFFFIPLTTITLSGLTPDRIPAAAGLSNFVRITAGAMGTSIATTLWESRATMHHAT
jgi:DHA2 family multidrug resistance protein